MTARKNFGALLESVFSHGDEVIIERSGKPMGVLIPMAQHQRLERQRAEGLATIEKLWASAPIVDDMAAAEREILEESVAIRHTQG